MIVSRYSHKLVIQTSYEVAITRSGLLQSFPIHNPMESSNIIKKLILKASHDLLTISDLFTKR